MAKVLIIIGDATECLDTMYPYFRIAEDGYEVVVAAPEKRLYHMVLHEIPPGTDWDITQETAGYHLQSDIAFRDVVPEEYAGLFVSGGRAPEYLRYDQDLLNLTRHFFEADKPVCSVCHGIEIIAPEEGEKFDPQKHQAMFEAPVPGTNAGDVIQVMAHGFMLHDRLLRPAHVGVSSTPPAA